MSCTHVVVLRLSLRY